MRLTTIYCSRTCTGKMRSLVGCNDPDTPSPRWFRKRWSMGLVSPCFFLMAIAVPGVAAEWMPVFPPPPRLAITHQELEEIRKSADFEALKAAAVASAEPLLKNPVPFPEGPGQWIFYYACPQDGNTLTPLSLLEHQCPQCKKVFTDERTVSAYRCRQHYDLEQAALRLGWAFAYTSEDRYAEEVKKILVRLGKVYETYPARWDRWGRTGFFAFLGGRRYAQSLDEGVGVIRLAKAYDLTRTSPAWSAEERRKVEEDFFRPTARSLLRYNQGINNHQTWYNAGLISIASVLGDADLVQKVLAMRGGFLDQLERSVGSDGLWYEGAMAYHNYALQAMVEIVEAGRRMGLPLHEPPRFRAMFEGPLHATYPNGQFPAINDSDFSNLDSFRPHFLWAWKTYGDPLFAQAYARGSAADLQNLLGPDASPSWPLNAGSRVLSDAGLVKLQIGSGPQAACAFLDWGPHGGGHGHFDKLNLMLFAMGREWLLDPGRLTYSHAEYQTWVKHTAAHNTVTLEGRDQAASEGRLLWFKTEEHFAACAAEAPSAYAGVSLRRFLLLTPSMLVELFEVLAGKPVQIDWLAHAISQKVQPAEERSAPSEISALGDRDGYPHLTEVRKWNVLGDSAWDFVGDDGTRLRVRLADPGGEEVFSAIGIGYQIGQRVPCLVRRRSAARTRFLAAYDLTGQGGHVLGLRSGKEQVPGIDTFPVEVDTAEGRWQITFGNSGLSCTIVTPPE